MARLTPVSTESPNGRLKPTAARAGAEGQRPRRKVARTLLWRLVASLLIFLAVAELGLRVVGLGHPYESEPAAYLPHPDPDVLFTLKPGYRGFSEGTQVAISSQGLRDREFAPEPPPTTHRILVLGDSVTFGTGVLAEETFSKRLEARLNAPDGGRHYEVVNSGVIGYNTVQERARLEQLGPRLAPDVVLLMFVVNDLLDTFSIFDHQYEPTDSSAPLKKWLRRNSRLYRFYQNVSWRLLDGLRKDPNRPELPRDHQRLLEREAEIVRIAQITHARGAQFFLALYPDNLYQQVSPDGAGRQITVREALLAFARAHAFPVLDLTEVIGDVRDPRARVMRLREDPHPSPTGHQAIADALFEALRGAEIVGP